MINYRLLKSANLSSYHEEVFSGESGREHWEHWLIKNLRRI